MTKRVYILGMDDDFVYIVRLSGDNQYYREFELFKIVATDEYGSHPCVETAEGPGCEPTEDLDKGYIHFYGTIRRGGCIDYTSPHLDKCMLHACSGDELVQLGVALGKAYDKAQEEMEVKK